MDHPSSTSSTANFACSSNEQVSIPLGGLFDPTQLAAKSQIPGAALEAAEFQSIARLANDVAAWQALLREPPARVAGKLPGLSELSSALAGSSLKPLAESIERKIQPDGTLADDASPELNRIRREQERQQRAIEESLRAALRKLSGEGSTQEDLITIRGDRFVIPVRSELKRRVSGVVHGASSSGQTVYVEPLETIEQNNELVRLIEEEQAEIHRIFVALTRQVSGYATALVARRPRARVSLDTLLARARFARDYDCVAPTFSPDRSPQRRPPSAARAPPPHHRRPHRAAHPRAHHRSPPAHHQRPQHRRQNRHPQNHRTARHDGPGRPADPAAAAASFPIFTAFLADIGDAQSIEAELSTFSAHIVNLNRLSQLADPNSLVLLDELGSATDPEEGSALAVAVAAHFLESPRVDAHLHPPHLAQGLRRQHSRACSTPPPASTKSRWFPTTSSALASPARRAGIQTAERLGLNRTIVAAAAPAPRLAAGRYRTLPR